MLSVVADLPAGTVTFVFTDIEGSTDLLRRLGKGYGHVLAEHRQLLRSAFEDHAGLEIDTQGDAFFVVFRSVGDAVAAAANAQRALADRDWPTGGRPRVRMGLHTGEPLLADERYLGLAVHRAARICSVAHGGQVLLSETTSAVLVDEEISAWELRDLGQHKLKDFERPQRIRQLVVEGLDSDFPPLRTLEAQPVKATPFAGQESELAAAARAAVQLGRRGVFAKWRTLASSADAQIRRRADLMREAIWESIRSPVNLVILAVGATLGILVSVWMSVPAALLYGWRLGATARAARRWRSLEWVGLRAHALARIAPDTELGRQAQQLGAACVGAARLAVDADRCLARADRRRLAHHLEWSREHYDLDRADLLARQIDALDRLANQRRLLERETHHIDSTLGEIREAIFRARIETSLREEVATMLTDSLGRIGATCASLGAAFQEASKYGATVRRKRLRLPLVR
jgi:class 3 adenylate cyclase